MTFPWKYENRNATKAPVRPRAPPMRTCVDDVPSSFGVVIDQIGAMGSLAKALKTQTQTSPQKIASTKCSKYSTPKRLLTSRAKRDPPRGHPKKAESAPAIPCVKRDIGEKREREERRNTLEFHVQLVSLHLTRFASTRH
jgi:hypothetical protein